MPLCSAFAKTQLLPTPPTPPAANKNWNPGDWVASGTDGTAQDAIWDKSGTTSTRGILQRLTARPEYQGAMLRYSWDSLERGNGEYGWTIAGKKYGMDQIQERLDQIAGLPGRRLIIFIQMKTFGDTSHAAPLWMRNDTSGTYESGETFDGSHSGEYAYVSNKVPPGPGGFVPNMHVTAVKNRFVAMMAEFATRFNNNPYLEAVAVTEASIAKPMNLANPGYTWNGTATWLNNMTSAFVSMRSSLSNIQLCQWVNSDRNDMEGWVPDLLAAGIGIGMPDFCKDEKGFNFTRSTSPAGAPGNIYWMNQSPTNAIRMVHMSKPAQEGSVLTPSQTAATAAPGQYTHPGLPWTRVEAAGYATTVVPGTHRLWRHETSNQVDNSTYAGQNFNAVTDAAMASIVATHPLENTPRPTGW